MINSGIDLQLLAYRIYRPLLVLFKLIELELIMVYGCDVFISLSTRKHLCCVQLMKKCYAKLKVFQKIGTNKKSKKTPIISNGLSK